ncbi:MAG: hypothetical protein KAW12_01905 [Candidatus Aminicenantes bacterium]|nr:hypothetical protein [Candidatus Aminicenantes bacterium]
MERFLKELQESLKKNFTKYRVEFIISTPRSLKANIYLDDPYFIAVRYNARNGRIDTALIKDNRRVFGYDNLKSWHFHPFENPEEHVFCDAPSIEKMVSDTRKYFEIDKKK